MDHFHERDALLGHERSKRLLGLSVRPRAADAGIKSPPCRHVSARVRQNVNDTASPLRPPQPRVELIPKSVTEHVERVQHDTHCNYRT